MSRRFLTLTAAALLMVPNVAQAQSLHPLSLANAPALQRAGAEVEDGSELRGGAKWIIGAVVLGLLIWGALELLDDGDEAFPVSP